MSYLRELQLGLRPLRRLGPGHYRSADRRWTFMRLESDPEPKRWLVFEGRRSDASNGAAGSARLRDAVAWTAERLDSRGVLEEPGGPPRHFYVTPDPEEGGPCVRCGLRGDDPIHLRPNGAAA